jgi:hypothetical protein
MAVVACAGGTSEILSTVGAPIDNHGAGGAAAASAAPAPAEDEAAGQLDGRVTGNDGYVLAIPRDDLKIVYTGSLELVVDDLPAALAKARTVVLATGGYIGASQESNDGEQSVATITYRIPASRWEDAIADLRELAARVVAEQTQATEVGGQIVDLEARVRNLEASEVALQEIAKGTGKVSDLLEVEAQLTSVRGQIEQLEAQLAQLNDQVAFGTMVATFGLEVQQVVQQAKGWDPSSDVDAAVATLVGAGQTVVSAFIWLAIVWLPVVLVVAVLAFVAWRLFRRLVPASGPAGPAGPADAIPGWGEG